MICSNCGTQNTPGAKFCTECASPLASICASCGTPNSATAKFCAECAAPLAAGAAAAVARPHASAALPTPGGTAATSARPATTANPANAAYAGPTANVAPTAERRLVSVLFADLVGFTPFAEERDAEDVRETLTNYFDLARDVIERYGGTVEKFIGDAVMAIWGAPTAHEDDAERAVRAALDLVDAVRTLGPTIQARAGVLTGEAAVTLGATNQGLVAGDLVNTAARLQSAAAPGTVLVGEGTHNAAQGAIAFEKADDQVLKGKSAPVAAWRALRVVAERGGRNRSEGIEAPFVGRDDDLRLLKDLFHATERDRRTRLVSVIGPGGIGKSRLAWEFLKYIDGLVETVWWHDGRSPSYGDGISFWALGEMVRSRCKLLETDDEATTRARVRQTVAEWVPDEREARWIESALLALLGVATDIGTEQLFAAWRTFFERLAATGPVVMVFEDLQFADSGLLDFIDHLLDWSKGVPIYIVTLARPDLLERRTDWGAGKRNFVSLALDPLTDAAMRDLLVGLVPGLPQTAVRAIVERADGIPLYAVETVRMLVSEGRLREEAGRYVPVGDLTELAVPDTLTALIGSRLDALPADARALLQDAAVLGQSFTPAALSAVSGIAPETLEPQLVALVRRELLRRDVDPRSPEHGQYEFVQALIREVAYHTLARKDRKSRHLAAARYFEGLGSDELAGALANHYLAAHANAAEGPETDALAGQARIALRAAADRAVELGSLKQAVAFLDQAIEVTQDPSEQADLLERAGVAASDGGLDGGQAEERIRRALALRRELGDRPLMMRTTAKLGLVLRNRLRRELAVTELEAAVAEYLPEDLPLTDPNGVELLAELARACMLTERHDRSITLTDRALAAAERIELVQAVAELLITRGTSLASIGRAYEGVGAMRAGLELAEQQGLIGTAIRARLNIGVRLDQSDPRAAFEVARAALDIAKRLGRRPYVMTLLGNAASSGLEIGDWDWILAEVGAAREDEVEELGRNYLDLSLVSPLAWRGDDVSELVAHLTRWSLSLNETGATGAIHDLVASVALGQLDFATVYDEELAFALTSSLNAPRSYAWAGVAALMLGDVVKARAALDLLLATGLHGRLARLDEARSGRESARWKVAPPQPSPSSATSWRAIGTSASTGGSRSPGLVMASVLDPATPAVTAVADEARAIMVRIGAKPFVGALDRALEPRAVGGAARPAKSAAAVPAP